MKAITTQNPIERITTVVLDAVQSPNTRQRLWARITRFYGVVYNQWGKTAFQEGSTFIYILFAGKGHWSTID